MMGKGSKNNCKSTSHKIFKDKEKNRVEDLQGMLTYLQSARKESRNIDVAVLEEQVHQMLREWKADLNEPSPASSVQHGGSNGSFLSEVHRLLHPYEEEDDATSPLAAPKPEPNDQNFQGGDNAALQQGYGTNLGQKEDHGFAFEDHCKDPPSEVLDMALNNFEAATHVDYHHFNLLHNFENSSYANFIGTDFYGLHLLPSVCPPPSAFLGPKCALWDCPRPARGGFDLCQDYCSSFHHTLALNEGPPGMAPVLRPGGIGLKDGLLFSALSAKAQGKDVGIPECKGAATTKSPWNAPELFDLSVLEGETVREWLFFDQSRKAFESGTRKQRSLPDYSGRGWHESRKQVMNEFGGMKRSYYMDPQPLNNFELHLYEYEMNKCEDWALYRLELKAADGKKSSKGKLTNDSVADLQKQMGRLTADFPSDNKRTIKGRAKLNGKIGIGNIFSAPVQPANDCLDYGLTSEYDYLVDDLGDCYMP